MAFVDNWVEGKEEVCYCLSKDIVGLVGNLAVQEWQSQHGFLPHPPSPSKGSLPLFLALSSSPCETIFVFFLFKLFWIKPFRF